MNLDLARRWIARWEGRRATVYKDSLGIPTIAVGLNLLTGQARSLMAELGLDHAKVLAGAIALTDEQIDHCLAASMRTAMDAARAIVPTFDYLADNQALVLTDLAFNLGEQRLRGFVHMLGYARLQKWTLAADELRNSAWFHQVGPGDHQRGGADANVMGGTGDPEAVLAA